MPQRSQMNSILREKFLQHAPNSMLALFESINEMNNCGINVKDVPKRSKLASEILSMNMNNTNINTNTNMTNTNNIACNNNTNNQNTTILTSSGYQQEVQSQQHQEISPTAITNIHGDCKQSSPPSPFGACFTTKFTLQKKKTPKRAKTISSSSPPSSSQVKPLQQQPLEICTFNNNTQTNYSNSLNTTTTSSTITNMQQSYSRYTSQQNSYINYSNQVVYFDQPPTPIPTISNEETLKRKYSNHETSPPPAIQYQQVRSPSQPNSNNNYHFHAIGSPQSPPSTCSNTTLSMPNTSTTTNTLETCYSNNNESKKRKVDTSFHISTQYSSTPHNSSSSSNVVTGSSSYVRNSPTTPPSSPPLPVHCKIESYQQVTGYHSPPNTPYTPSSLSPTFGYISLNNSPNNRCVFNNNASPTCKLPPIRDLLNSHPYI